PGRCRARWGAASAPAPCRSGRAGRRCPPAPWRCLQAAWGQAAADRPARRRCRWPWPRRHPLGWRQGFRWPAPAPPLPPRAAPPPWSPTGRAPALKRPRARRGRAGPSPPQGHRRDRCAAGSSRLGQYEVVAVDDDVAATIAEDGRDFTALVPGDQLDVAARIGRKPAARLASGLCLDDHAIAAVEGAVDTDDAGGKEALALAQRARRAVVDDDHAGGVDRAGDPGLAG